MLCIDKEWMTIAYKMEKHKKVPINHRDDKEIY